ncbi:MAG: M48 family metalloprotease [Reichenbachiella sp.]|uniref:M48 family metalloprotease n=1 Tax=Reichenbachiella sp. TaxID=2184521 RepID=UPI003297BCD1
MISEFEDHKIYQRKNKDEYDLSYFRQVEEGMVKLIKQGRFYDDENLTNYLLYLKNKLIDGRYTDRSMQVHILVDKTSSVNAFTLGRCTIVVNNGLLSKMETEEQFAFVLAHEIAHIELKHVYKKLNTIDQNKIDQDLNMILLEDVNTEDMEEFKNQMYDFASFNRELEAAADSLGYLIYSNVYNNPRAPIEALGKIDSNNPERDKIGLELFKPFNFRLHPFDRKWIREDLNHFSDRSDRVLFLKMDSITSHPEMSLRLDRLLDQISVHVYDSINTETDIAWLNKTSSFEIVNFSLKTNAYARGLYEALKMKYYYPDDKMISTLLAEVLIQIHDHKRDGLFDMYFSRYTIGYSSDLRMVHNFIRNISYQEISGVAFNFLGQAKNFDILEPMHYKLLVSICERMGRTNQAKKIKYQYEAKFDRKW